MYEENLFIKDGIIYYTTYKYNKKYRYSNAMWILYMLSFTYIVIIDIFINDNGFLRSKIDAINVSEESYLRGKCA